MKERTLFSTAGLLFLIAAVGSAGRSMGQTPDALPAETAADVADLTEEASEPAAEATPTPVDRPAIERWVAQLDDDQFAARQWAQRRLQAVGIGALEPVANAAREGSLEASHRAVDLLIAWTESDDHQLRIRALEHLAKLPHRPTESALAEEALADVRQAAALARLRAAGAVVVADKGSLAMHRNQMPLQIVIGPNWRGGEQGLADLADVHAAAAVSFHSSPVGEEAVPQLVKLDHIQRIEFFGTTISEEAVETLKAEMPTLRQVEVRPGGAQLGIEGSTAQLGKQGAYVHVVHAGSAAARAGLQSRDLITQINGEEVADFRALTLKIGNYQPGEAAELVVERRGKSVTLQVKFDRWGEAPHPGAMVVPADQKPSTGGRDRDVVPSIVPPARQPGLPRPAAVPR